MDELSILQRCHVMALDCLYFYDSEYCNNKLSKAQDLDKYLYYTTVKDILEIINLINVDSSDIIFEMNWKLELLLLKTGIIRIVLEHKALNHRKFTKLIPSIKILFKLQCLNSSEVYSIIKKLNPQWENVNGKERRV